MNVYARNKISQEFSSEVVRYNPKNILPENVSYHSSVDQFTIQWWYFEGIFENGYNAVVNLILLSRSPIGICISHLHIFHINDNNISFSKRKVTPIQQFVGNEHYPDIFLQGNRIIDFDQNAYNISGKWIYNLTLEIDQHAVDLKFTGLSSGWEGETIGGLYGPVLPTAEVEGSLRVNNDMVEVIGIGYHEHAHGIPFPIKQWGWYWGKIIGNNYSVFWGKMMQNRWQELARAAVFSCKGRSFIDIKPENIKIELTDYLFHSRRFIPTTFIITISDKINEIYINVIMESINIYHLPFGFYNYWRYVLKINGEINYHELKEPILNKTQIMEFMYLG